MAPGATLEAVDGPARLGLPAATSGSWDVDNRARTAVDGGTERFRWTGFTAFVASDDLDFAGSDADELVQALAPQSEPSPLLHASMGGGDDTVVLSRAPGETVLGGTGTDHLVAAAYASVADLEADPEAATVTLSLPQQTGRLGGDPITWRGFERFSGHAFSRVVVRGTAGHDDVAGTSCDLAMSTGDGSDRLAVEAARWRDYDDDLYCAGGREGAPRRRPARRRARRLRPRRCAPRRVRPRPDLRRR